MRIVAGIMAFLAAGAAGIMTDAAVSGRIVILEKDNKPSEDLSDEGIYLEAPAMVATAGNQTTVEIAITDKTYAPHVVVVPVGSTVRVPNPDQFNHNVFSVSRSEER